MIIRGIILAGGSSKRMGTNKLMMKVDGEPIIYKVIENVKKSKIDEIVLVFGKYDVETDLHKVYNKNYTDGMSTSLIAGMDGFDGDAVMILLGDMPFVGSAIIDKLYESYKVSKKNIVVPMRNGRRGNPVIIGRRYFKDILSNDGDKGARDIIKHNTDDVEWVEVDENGIFIDIDDMEGYNEITLNKEKKGETYVQSHKKHESV